MRVPYWDLRDGDKVIRKIGGEAEPLMYEVHRDAPDVPTRWNSDARYRSNGLCSVVVPHEWADQEVTCILGKDELPEALKAVFDLWDFGENVAVFAYGIPGHPYEELRVWAKRRWPEAFAGLPYKEQPK